MIGVYGAQSESGDELGGRTLHLREIWSLTSMGRVFVVTNEFPFGKSEQFLELEAVHWPADWICVPCNAMGGQRQLAVRINLSLAGVCKPGLSLRDIGALLSWSFIVEVTRSFHRLVWAPSNLMRLVSFSVLSRRVTAALDQLDLRAGDVIYAYWSDWAAHGVACYRETRRLPFRIVSRAHRGDLYRSAHPLGYMPYGQRWLDGLDYVLPVSENGAQYLRDVVRIETARLQVHRLGTPAPAQLVGRFPRDEIRVLSVSNMVPAKRVLHIARAVVALREMGCRVVWRHYGDGEHFRRVQEYCQQCGLGASLKGAVANEAVRAAYADYGPDVFVNASSSEGVPVAIMEALSFGVPVVATAVGGTPELVTPEVGALIAPECTAEEIACAIHGVWKRDIPGTAVAAWHAEIAGIRNFNVTVGLLCTLASTDSSPPMRSVLS
jgi:glycosyltransferase involved in cell wall biosynthesis